MTWTGTGTADVPTTTGTMYATYAQVDARVANLSALIPTGKVALTWVEGFIEAASAQIDAKLLGVYALPLASESILIRNICIDLTRYMLMRENYGQDDAEVTDYVEGFRRNAEALLQQIHDGELQIDATVEVAGLAQNSEAGVAREFTLTKKDSEGNVISTGSMEIW